MPISKAFRTGLLATMALTLNACATAVVVPPENPANPRPAFILDHGRHTTLVVVDSSGRPVRYAFGELDHYVNGDMGFFRGMSALLMPNSGALGRRVLPGPPTLENVRAAVGVEVEEMYCFAVSGERADRLQRVLNLAFEENLATARYDKQWKLQFVDNAEDYWFGDSANEAVGNWLEELDCEVSGLTAFANWKVEQPEGITPKVCLANDATDFE